MFVLVAKSCCSKTDPSTAKITLALDVVTALALITLGILHATNVLPGVGGHSRFLAIGLPSIGVGILCIDGLVFAVKCSQKKSHSVSTPPLDEDFPKPVSPKKQGAVKEETGSTDCSIEDNPPLPPPKEEKGNSPKNLLDLPTELLRKCFEFLPGPKSMQAARSTCRALHSIAGQITCEVVSYEGVISFLTFKFVREPETHRIKRMIVTDHLRMSLFGQAKHAAKMHKGREAEFLRFVAKNQANAGLIEEARNTFAEARDAAIKSKNVSLPETLSKIAEAQAEAGLIEEARNTFAEARDAAIKSKYVSLPETLSKIAEAQAKAGLVEEARNTFAEAKDAALIRRDYGLPTRIQTLESIANAQIRVGFFDEAKGTAIITSWGKMADFLQSIAEAQANAGLAEEARNTLAEAKDAAIKIKNSHKYKAQTLKFVARAQAKAGLVEEARNSFAEAKDAAIKIKDEDDESWIIDDSETMSIKVLVWIGEAQTEAGLVGEARNTLAESKDAAVKVENFATKSKLLFWIGKAQAEAGLVGEARNTFAEKKDAAIQIESFKRKAMGLSYAAAGLARTGLVEEARNTFAEAKVAAIKIEDLGERADILLRCIADAQAKAGFLDEVKSTVNEIVDLGFGDQVFYLLQIASELISVGLIGEAQNILAEAKETVIKEENFETKSELLFKIAKDQARAGLFDEAKNTANEIHDSETKDSVLRKIGEAQTEAGLFDEAKGTAIEIRDSKTKDSVLCTIAEAQTKAGLFDEAKDTAIKIRDSETKDSVLRTIAKAQTEAGLFKDAINTANLIRNPRRKDHPTIALAQGKAGLLDSAMLTIGNIRPTKYICTKTLTIWTLCDIAAFDSILSKDTYLGQAITRAQPGNQITVSVNTFSIISPEAT